MEKQSRVQFDFNKAWCKACGICVKFCPKDVLEKDEEGKPVFAHPDKCIVCGLCELRCPDFAIRVGRNG